MPVPVPRFNPQPAHPIVKRHRFSDPPYPASTAASLNLSGPNRGIWNFPTSHRIPEEDFLESWGFTNGLTTADNANVIKGARAQACLPPIHSLPLDQESERSNFRHSTGHMNWDLPANSDDEADMMQVSPCEVSYVFNRGAFSPVLEDASPAAQHEYDPCSSPIGPLTPFGDFIDRAIADDASAVGQANIIYGVHSQGADSHFIQLTHEIVPSPSLEKEASVVDFVSAPSAAIEYKKLVDPLSDWLAHYVWRVCTTGAGLPHPFYRPSSYPNRFSKMPPPELGVSIRSLLLSTLLQPSAVFLSLWYIMRLPVYIGPVAFGTDYPAESQFRSELLAGSNGDPETHVPFRVFLLGCMLANKWLDDHTFSNKTWHTISQVPIRSLNNVEFFALATFNHDISITPQKWSQWLSDLLVYHCSLQNSGGPQPIARPSANPHSLLKRSLEELLKASEISLAQPSLGAVNSSLPQPVFLGLDERRREKSARDDIALEDIDLDEDGPLREEYLPKRRNIRARSQEDYQESVNDRAVHPFQPMNVDRSLPPPAKWSPKSDEVLRDSRNRTSGQYMAPQAPLLRDPFMAPSFANATPWAFGGLKHEFSGHYPSVMQTSQFGDYGYQYCPPHVRNQPFGYSQENPPRLHSRSVSQHSNYGYLPENPLVQPCPPDQFGYYAYPMADDFHFSQYHIHGPPRGY